MSSVPVRLACRGVLSCLAACAALDPAVGEDARPAAAWLPPAAATVEAFRALADNRVAVRTSYGVRYARPLGEREVEIAIGLSVSASAGEAGAYRVVSFDDDRYAYPRFVRPLAAALASVPEAPGVEGASLTEFRRTTVTLTLPFAMLDGKTYHVIAQGGGADRNQALMVTAAHSAQSFTYRRGVVPPAPGNAVDLAVLGLRGVEPVGPALIGLEFGADFAPTAGMAATNYTVRVNGAPVRVANIGRRTMVETFVPDGWPYKAIPVHELFLQLERPFEDGDTVDVEAAVAVTTAARTAGMRFDGRATLSHSIKVNQVGYLTESPAKIAYLGRWMGSFPEGTPGANPSLLFAEAPPFAVCEQGTGREVFSGRTKLVHAAGTFDEGVYKHDHSGENVYQIDFTAFRQPGEYFLSVPHVGRSLTFRIADDVYAAAFRIQGYGLFVQRCGVELGPPFSEWRRIACHTNGIVPLAVSRLDGYDWKKFPTQADGTRVLRATGGHHDAGDYNPRSHIDVAQTLMDAYEVAPVKFGDGQLGIPERANGLPDILDEAAWALRLWLGLQDDDGGVHNGTESNGDPNFIQSVELDVLGDYAFAKDAAGSLAFAGAMAQASRIWKGLGRDAEAADFLRRARRAYDWAAAHRPGEAAMKTDADRQARWASPLAYAAAELLLTTGEERFNADFLGACVWRAKADAALDTYKVYDQSRAAWAYARCKAEVADPVVQRRAREAIVREAEARIAAGAQMAYAFVRSAYAPISWGTGAYENGLPPVIWAWKLTGDERYRLWIIRTCDNTLGANPLGRSYIVGAGARTVRAPLHNSRYSHFGEVVMGQQVEGPHARGEGYRVMETAYPKLRENFASLYTFADCHFCIAMDEGVSPAQAKSMATFGLLLPDGP